MSFACDYKLCNCEYLLRILKQPINTAQIVPYIFYRTILRKPQKSHKPTTSLFWAVIMLELVSFLNIQTCGSNLKLSKNHVDMCFFSKIILISKKNHFVRLIIISEVVCFTKVDWLILLFCGFFFKSICCKKPGVPHSHNCGYKSGKNAK